MDCNFIGHIERAETTVKTMRYHKVILSTALAL